MEWKEIESIGEFDETIELRGSLANTVVQSLDLIGRERELGKAEVEDAIFLGCRMTPSIIVDLIARGALIFPKLPGVPYDPYRNSLYHPSELMAGYETGGRVEDCFDAKVYAHYVETGGAFPGSIVEMLARRLHDHAMTDALMELIDGRKVAGIMGGHSIPRDDPHYLEVALIARRLTCEGFLMTSGGGPGAMEATHLGAYFAWRSEADLCEAVDMLARAPSFEPREAWLDTALGVVEKYPMARSPEGVEPVSLGVPTWTFGHEPPTIFPTHIAKYFANSVREDGLVSIARHGIIFTRGSAGTIQEVFQDACQNHYAMMGTISPMIFLGRRFWTENVPVFPLIKRLAEGREYGGKLYSTDSIDEVIDILMMDES